MTYVLFFFYLVLFTWLVPRISFIKNSGLNTRTLSLLFLLKVYVGILYGLFTYQSPTGSDNWAMHLQGIDEFHLLFSNPRGYLVNLFQDNYNNNFGGFLEITDSYWNLLRSEIMAKILSIFDIFSGCNYYSNTIFYNFFVFFGFIALFRIFNAIYPGKEKLLMISIFLLPSLLYFTSGIHKDGLIFLGISLTAYNFRVMLVQNRLSIYRIIFVLLGLAIIFLLRNYVMITLLPALVAWALAFRNQKNVLQRFIIIYTGFTIIFFSLYLINPKLNLPGFVSKRQIAFIKISVNANSAININPLFPDFRSFFNNAPQALNHSLMRPYLLEKMSYAYIITGGEIFVYEVLFLLFLLYPLKNKVHSPFTCFAIFFALSMMMIIGYTIPVIGAIVRYRSIYFPFLIAPIVCSTDWGKLTRNRHIK